MEERFYEINSTKNQKEHFVPKWYLRNFSSTSDHGYIWVYNTKLREIKEEPINKMAQKQGFYGKNFEDFLDPIDTRTKLVIENIISNENIDNLTHENLDTLYEFIVLQYYRTEHAKEIVERQVRKTIKFKTFPKVRAIYKHISDETFEEILRLPPNLNFFLFNIGIALSSKKAISDLTPYLIKNNTNMPFITSDDPVAFNNRYHVTNKFLIGFQSPGVQIICPINKKYCLMLVHRDAYTVKNTNKSLIQLTSKNDVELFNKLQILDSYVQIFSERNPINFIPHLHWESRMMARSKQLNKELQNTLPNIIKEYEKIERKNYGVHFSFLERNENFVKNKWPKYLKNASLQGSRLIRNNSLTEEVDTQVDSFVSPIMKEYQLAVEQRINQLEL
jgi:hypothetical protein